jgi:DNA-binding Lrp family transcriptional regulator
MGGNGAPSKKEIKEALSFNLESYLTNVLLEETLHHHDDIFKKKEEEIGRTIEEAKKHILTSSTNDYVISRGRELRDYNMILLTSNSPQVCEKYGGKITAINAALVDIYKQMKSKGIEIATNLRIQTEIIKVDFDLVKLDTTNCLEKLEERLTSDPSLLNSLMTKISYKKYDGSTYDTSKYFRREDILKKSLDFLSSLKSQRITKKVERDGELRNIAICYATGLKAK